LIARELAPPDAQALAHETQPRGLEVAAPPPAVEPASESLLGPIRTLYANMEFGKAARTLLAAEEELIAGRLPSPGLQRVVAEAELWVGALLWLAKDATGAADHWELAHRLAPSARPDRLFPPQVHQAFAKAAPEPRAVPIALKLAPAGARLWLDGKRAGDRVSASPGLHWIVVERADFKPQVQLVRIPLAAPQIAVDLREPAAPADALARAATIPLGRDEGLAVSKLVDRPLWIVSVTGGQWEAIRFAASDPKLSVAQREEGDAPRLVAALLSAEGLGPPPEPLVEVKPPPPKKPLYKRGWFWGTVAAAVVVVVGVSVGAALGATAPRDYDLHVR
jgi:hypothetical protein